MLFGELTKSAGQDARLDSHVERLRPQLGDVDTMQYRARRVAEDICLALQGVAAGAPRPSRPSPKRSWPPGSTGQWGGAFGTMPTGLDLAPILERAMIKG